MTQVTLPTRRYKLPPFEKCPHCQAQLIEPAPNLPEPELVRATLLMQEQSQTTAPPEPGGAVDSPLYDHVAIGGKVTVCVLLYGTFIDLHKRCLDSIVRSVPKRRLDLRVACNQIGPATRQYLTTLPITKTYMDEGDRKKYPAMRAMFEDHELPISTKWVVWFDDDSYVRDPYWLLQLMQLVTAQPEGARIGACGDKKMHPLQISKTRDPRPWFMHGSWWKGKPFQTRTGAPAPNGTIIHFPVGGFFAVSTDAIRTACIPDIRLDHNGDVCLGAQLYQNDFKTLQFNTNKCFVNTSAAPPRGASLKRRFPWY